MIRFIIYNTDEPIKRGQIMKEKPPALPLCPRPPSRRGDASVPTPPPTTPAPTGMKRGDASVPSEPLLKPVGKFRDIRCLLMGEGCRLLGGLLPALGLC